VYSGTYVDEPLLYVNGSTKCYVSSNHLYSVAALTDSMGDVVERYRYDAYGKRTVLNSSGTSISTSTVGFQIGFTGRYHDAETGLVYFRNRMYSSTLGRFLRRDPLGYVDGNNLYSSYFIPNHVDPYGLKKPCKSVEYCAEIVGKIISNGKKFLSDLHRYDPISDGQGGFPIPGVPGRLTKPRGHFQELMERKTGLKNDISKYIEDCIDCDDPCNPDRKRVSVPRWVDEMINRPIPEPIIPRVPTPAPAPKPPGEPWRVPQIPAPSPEDITNAGGAAAVGAAIILVIYGILQAVG